MFNKKYIVLTAILVIALFTAGCSLPFLGQDYKLTVTVIDSDENGDAVAEALVLVEYDSEAVWGETNSKGEVTFTVPKGDVKVKAVKDADASDVETVKVEKDTEVELDLNPSAE